VSRLVNPLGCLCKSRKLIAAMLDVVARLAIEQTILRLQTIPTHAFPSTPKRIHFIFER
jgi:hypothetical protein